MKINVFIGIGIRIIILFMVAILATYVPVYLNRLAPDFLGDAPNGDYGVRHYWFTIMMILLFLLSLVNFIISTVKIILRNYDTSNW